MDAMDAAERVVRREFPDAAVSDVRDVSGGMKFTAVVELADGDAVVVHVRESPALGREFALEPAVLRHVAARTSLPVPAVLASAPDADPPYYVTRYVEGDPLSARYRSLSRGAQRAVLVDAGRWLARLHRDAPTGAHGRLRPTSGGDVTVAPEDSWAAFLEALLREWTAELDGGRFAALAPAFDRVAAACADRLDGDFESALLHFDYRPENLLVRDGAGTGGAPGVVAVLDWGLSVAGHPEYDLFKFEKNFLRAQFASARTRAALRPALFRGYREVRDLSSGWRARRDLYRVAYTLESMRSFPRWTREADPARRAELAATLRAELADGLARLRLD